MEPSCLPLHLLISDQPFPCWPEHPCHSVCTLCEWNICTSQSRWLHLCTAGSVEFPLPSNHTLETPPSLSCSASLLFLHCFPLLPLSQTSTKHQVALISWIDFSAEINNITTVNYLVFCICALQLVHASAPITMSFVDFPGNSLQPQHPIDRISFHVALTDSLLTNIFTLH